MNANRLIRAALVIAVIGILSGFTLFAQQPKDNPFRDGKGKTVADVRKKPEGVDSELDRRLHELEKDRKKAIEASLVAKEEARILNLERDILVLEYDLHRERFKRKTSDPTLEANLRVEEILHVLRRNQVTVRLSNAMAQQATERERLKALKDALKASDPKLLAAIDEYDAIALEVKTIRADLVAMEKKHIEEMGRRKVPLLESPFLPRELEIQHELDVKRELLKRIRLQEVAKKEGLEEITKADIAELVKEIQALRREVKELREAKKP